MENSRHSGIASQPQSAYPQFTILEPKQVNQPGEGEKPSGAISKKRSRILRTLLAILFTASIICFIGLLLVASWFAYHKAGKMDTDLYGKAAEFALQLAFVILIGVPLTAYINWGMNRNIRRREKLEAQIDFLRRVRSMHVTVEYSRSLLNAHHSARTYTRRLRRLMKLHSEVEEISEDLRASRNLFAEQNSILGALEGIIQYLGKGGDEYIRKHDDVSAGHGKQTLNQTTENEKMVWVADFMSQGPVYKREYEANLKNSKKKMRDEVFER